MVKVQNQIYFHYKEHPGDFLRDDSIQELPDPYSQKQDFWVWFLPNYQNDETVSVLNDLYKIHDDCFSDENEKAEFILRNEIKNNKELDDKINQIEECLSFESYKNFYQLIRSGKLEIFENGEK